MRSQFPVLRLFENFDDYFARGVARQFFDDAETLESRYLPTVTSKETDEAFMLTAELPGVKREDLNIDVTGRQLTVSGENVGRSRVKFSRTITLPDNIETSKIEAHLEDGLLHVALPKIASAQKRKIEIQSGRTGFFSKLLSGATEQ